MSHEVCTEVDRFEELLTTQVAFMALWRLLASVQLHQVHLHVVAVREGLVAHGTWITGSNVILVMKQDVLSQPLSALVGLAAHGAVVHVSIVRSQMLLEFASAGQSCSTRLAVVNNSLAMGLHHVLLKTILTLQKPIAERTPIWGSRPITHDARIL